MTTSTRIRSSGLNEGRRQPLPSGLAGIPSPSLADKIARLVQSIRAATPALSSRASPAGLCAVRFRKTIVAASVAVPRSKASKTQLRSLRAAEMEYWNATGGDALRLSARTR